MLENYTFSSGTKGKKILFLGSVHGDEKCGSKAIDFFIDQIKNGKIDIRKGSVIFMPRVNKKAYIAGKRYIDCNLNRIIGDSSARNTQEGKIAKELEIFIKKADLLVDLHSMSSITLPMVFVDYNKPRWLDLGKGTGISHLILDWPKAYKNKSNKHSDTTHFAMKKNIPGITVECGQHRSKNSVVVAKRVIENILSYFEIIGSRRKNSFGNRLKIYSVEKVFFKDDKNNFTKNWRNFEFIKKNKIIARGPSEGIVCPKDSYILLPNKNAKKGDEWFYLGKLRGKIYND